MDQLLSVNGLESYSCCQTPTAHLRPRCTCQSKISENRFSNIFY